MMEFFPDAEILSVRGADMTKRFYDELPPKEDMKGSRCDIMCTHCCFVPGPREKQLQKCSNCKAAWYCSKECQKKAWPLHKPICVFEETGFSPIVKRILGNQMLLFFLHMALVHIFDLKSGKHSPDVPLLAKIIVGVEPANIVTLMAMRQGKPPPEVGKIQGMFQLNRVEAAREAVLRAPLIENFKRVRRQLTAQGLGADHVVVLEWSKGNDSGNHTLSVPVHIDQFAIERALDQEGFSWQSVITGEMSTKPKTAVTCIECINNYIRYDIQDAFKMRTPMTDKNMELIRDAIEGRNSDKSDVKALKHKWASESIYTPTVVMM